MSAIQLLAQGMANLRQLVDLLGSLVDDLEDKATSLDQIITLLKEESKEIGYKWDDSVLPITNLKLFLAHNAGRYCS